MDGQRLGLDPLHTRLNRACLPTRCAAIFQLAVRAGAAVQAVVFELAVGAGVARRAVVFHPAVRASFSRFPHLAFSCLYSFSITSTRLVTRASRSALRYAKRGVSWLLRLGRENKTLSLPRKFQTHTSPHYAPCLALRRPRVRSVGCSGYHTKGESSSGIPSLSPSVLQRDP